MATPVEMSRPLRIACSTRPGPEGEMLVSNGAGAVDVIADVVGYFTD